MVGFQPINHNNIFFKKEKSTCFPTTSMKSWNLLAPMSRHRFPPPPKKKRREKQNYTKNCPAIDFPPPPKKKKRKKITQKTKSGGYGKFSLAWAQGGRAFSASGCGCPSLRFTGPPAFSEPPTKHWPTMPRASPFFGGGSSRACLVIKGTAFWLERKPTRKSTTFCYSFFFWGGGGGGSPQKQLPNRSGKHRTPPPPNNCFVPCPKSQVSVPFGFALGKSW